MPHLPLAQVQRGWPLLPPGALPQVAELLYVEQGAAARTLFRPSRRLLAKKEGGCTHAAAEAGAGAGAEAAGRA